jgi:hypothetical protein
MYNIYDYFTNVFPFSHAILSDIGFQGIMENHQTGAGSIKYGNWDKFMRIGQ